MSFRRRALLVAIVTAVAYAPSLRNQHALDDALVIERNVIVQRGIVGLGEIFARDSYAGFYETVGAAPQLAGGRYRPLALATFAIEQSLFGKTLGDTFRATPDAIARVDLLENEMRKATLVLAPLRHAVSLALYIALAIALLALLETHLLPQQPLMAFVATLLFALHPLHTEVVANLKSRDEILSLLFIVLTLDRVFRDQRRAALVCFALALLSKEYAVMLPIVVVVALYVVRGIAPTRALQRWLPSLLAVLAAYALLRYSATGIASGVPLAQEDLLNDPFLKLRTGEAMGSILATKLAILPTYLRLLIWPYPQSADYSYATFAYATWSDPRVWLALALHVLIVVAAVIAIRRRHLVGLALAWYLAFLLPVANLLFDIGATMGERLIFHASVGFALAFAYGIVRVLRDKRVLVALIVTPILIAYGALTFSRTRAWYDDATLFSRDVQTVPNSALVNANVGGQLTQVALQIVRAHRLAQQSLTDDDRRTINDYTDRARPYLERALTIHPRLANAWINLGLLHWTRDEFAAAADAWTHAAAILPSHAVLLRYSNNFHIMGNSAAREGDLSTAIQYYEYATRMAPREPTFWRDLAGARFMTMQFDDARAAFAALLAIAPTDQDAARGRAAAAGLVELEAAAALPTADRATKLRFADALAHTAATAFQERAARLRSESR